MKDTPKTLNLKLDGTTVAGIDLVRGVLAILVLIAHALGSTKKAGLFDGSSSMWAELMEYSIGRGRFWVGGFFFLSGFCIANSVFRGFENNTYCARMYLWQRITRIYPLFIIGLGFAVISWFLNRNISDDFPAVKFSLSLLNLQNFYKMFPHYEPSWSITNEFVYYLLLPLLILLVGRNLRRIAISGIALCLVVVVCVGGIWKISGESPSWLIPFWTIPAAAVVWFSGVFLRDRWPQNNIRQTYKWWGPLFCVLIIYLAKVTSYWYGVSTYIHIFISYLAIIPFYFTILSMREWSLLNSETARKITKNMGFLSYPLYLFHAPIQGAIDALILPQIQCLPHCLVWGHSRQAKHLIPVFISGSRSLDSIVTCRRWGT